MDKRSHPRVHRLPIVGVMGSGRDRHEPQAQVLGRWLAGQGVHLLTGGGRGVMAAVSEAFAQTPGRRGLVLGILPSHPEDPGRARTGYPNPWVEVPVYTHLPLSGDRGGEPFSRNHINVLTADVIVALPGGAGTASEVRLAVSYGRPVIAFVPHRTDIPALPDAVPAVADFSVVQAFLRRHLASTRQRA